MFQFVKRKKQLRAGDVVRGLLNRSVVGGLAKAGDVRLEPRCNRTMPVVLAPIENESIVADDSMFALTKNVNGLGIGVVVDQPVRARDVVVGLWTDPAPVFVRGEIRRSAPFGGDFWQLGIEFHEILPADFPGLTGLAAPAGHLVP